MRQVLVFMFTVALFAGEGFAGRSDVSSGRWVMWGEKPAGTWQDAYVTGNGRHGTMVMGRPGKETITCVHEELFMPAWDRDIDALPDIAHLLPEVRRLVREGKSGEASALADAEARKQLAPKGVSIHWPVVPHPAFDLHRHSRRRNWLPLFRERQAACH